MTDQPSPPSATPSRPRRRRDVAPEIAGSPSALNESLGGPALEAAIGSAASSQDLEGGPPSWPAAPPSVVPTSVVPTIAAPAPRAVEFGRGAIGGIRAQDVHVRSGVVGGIAGEHASVEMGMVGGIAAREASVSQGYVRTVVGQEVRIEQSLVRGVIANRVQAGPTTAIAFVVARRVDGNARILFDWRGTLALAAVFGALAAALRLRRR